VGHRERQRKAERGRSRERQRDRERRKVKEWPTKQIADVWKQSLPFSVNTAEFFGSSSCDILTMFASKLWKIFVSMPIHLFASYCLPSGRPSDHSQCGLTIGARRHERPVSTLAAAARARQQQPAAVAAQHIRSGRDRGGRAVEAGRRLRLRRLRRMMMVMMVQRKRKKTRTKKSRAKRRRKQTRTSNSGRDTRVHRPHHHHHRHHHRHQRRSKGRRDPADCEPWIEQTGVDGLLSSIYLFYIICTKRDNRCTAGTLLFRVALDASGHTRTRVFH
jgi:hypothetical protein